jgi:hypothetical protein
VRNDISALRRSRLSWTNKNFIRNETLTEANACLVATQNSIPLVRAGGRRRSGFGRWLPVRRSRANIACRAPPKSPKYFGYENGAAILLSRAKRDGFDNEIYEFMFCKWSKRSRAWSRLLTFASADRHSS